MKRWQTGLLAAALLAGNAAAGVVDGVAKSAVAAATRLALALSQRDGAVARALAEDASRLLAAGRLEEAYARAQLAGRLNAELASGEAQMLGQRLEQAALEYRVQRSGSAVPPAGDTLGELAARVPLAVADLQPGVRPLMRALQRAESSIFPFDVVDASVKNFADDFSRGAADPQVHLRALEGAHAGLARDWRRVPRERRLFVIGAAADEPQVDALRDALRADGWEVFFYRRCAQVSGTLCPSEAVGAFFGSSGHTMVLESAAAAASSYVQVEVASARRVQGLQGAFVLVATQDLQRAAATGSRVSGVLAGHVLPRRVALAVMPPASGARSATPRSPRTRQ